MKRALVFAFAALAVVPAAAGATTVAERYGWVPTTYVMPLRVTNPRVLEAQAKGGKTLPYFTSTIKSPLNGLTYSFKIVGTNPQTQKVKTDIPVVPIALRLHFSDGTVLDATKPGCNDTVSVADRFYLGPNFVGLKEVSNGIDVGKTQVTDAFMRAEFWKYAANSNYHVELKKAGPVIVLDVTAPTGSTTVAGVCSGSAHNIGEIPVNAYDALVTQISQKYAKPNQLPLILTYNTVFTSGGCCIIGYHGTYGTKNGGTQVYSVGTYNDAGVFSSPIEDIHVWTHEIGEALNDPFGDNPVPAWGHVGQQSGCQTNLEVGDPLTGTPYEIAYKGFTYHPQELAFFSWFFRSAPSLGTGGLYSFEGSFKSVQGTCT